MNRENIERLIAHLEAIDPKNFDMKDWVTTKEGCGTAACICGWAAILEYPDVPRDWETMCDFLEKKGREEGYHRKWGTFTAFGMHWFGVAEYVANCLFQPDVELVRCYIWDRGHTNLTFSYDRLTPAMAVVMLRRLLDKGAVNHEDWAEVFIENSPLRPTP